MTNRSFAKQTENSLPSCLLVLRKRVAFTLAEVLITLGIIGVVAAMTIPSLIAKHQEKVNVVRLKKFYSQMQNATRLAIDEYGTIDTWGMKYTGSLKDPDPDVQFDMRFKNLSIFWNNYSKYMYLSYGRNKDLDGFIYNLNKKAKLDLPKTSANMLFNDGIIIRTTWLTPEGESCKSGSGSCGDFAVDLNGAKGPNAVGQDIFFFMIAKDGIIPFGMESEKTGYTFKDNCLRSKEASSNGYGCTAWVLFNENMDYLHCDDLSWEGKHKCK